MRIVIAGDHASPALKRTLAEHLRARGHEVRDLGTDDETSVDYPDYAAAACREVLAGRAERAVLICGTGIGIGIAANKIPGIRCAIAHSPETGRLAWEHNQAQALALGARVLDPETAKATVDAWLAARADEGERHRQRLAKIAALEQRPCSTASSPSSELPSPSTPPS
ncbi:MAG: RpiB/LacA/LacB family sugar-phosphate isomerase [Planctomycetota bacterium]|nr:RpiB/LacA/LacB family sugar-phosphate isomerase [Planctomycetota bacterium]MCX8040001.1 RpiB/LacA/LacB family sugar-phosphate isomerase [Planctomycetota bacterium]MDW8372909.1 RpiB/LacA/LacB family sugar-phosphate isomerase [Planctomycetota bacterium]